MKIIPENSLLYNKFSGKGGYVDNFGVFIHAKTPIYDNQLSTTSAYFWQIHLKKLRVDPIILSKLRVGDYRIYTPINKNNFIVYVPDKEKVRVATLNVKNCHNLVIYKEIEQIVESQVCTEKHTDEVFEKFLSVINKFSEESINRECDAQGIWYRRTKTDAIKALWELAIGKNTNHD